jgi:hypothetical protein
MTLCDLPTLRYPSPKVLRISTIARFFSAFVKFPLALAGVAPAEFEGICIEPSFRALCVVSNRVRLFAGSHLLLPCIAYISPVTRGNSQFCQAGCQPAWRLAGTASHCPKLRPVWLTSGSNISFLDLKFEFVIIARLFRSLLILLSC